MTQPLPDPQELLSKQTDEQQPKEETPLSPELTFTIDVKGAHQQWTGEFTYRVPNIGETIQVGQLKAVYLAKNTEGADPLSSLLAEMVAYLGVTLKKSPPWWKPLEMFDRTPLEYVYGRALDHERKFLGRDQNSGAVQDGAAGSEAGQGELETAGGTDVGRKVQPPAERSETLISHSKGSA